MQNHGHMILGRSFWLYPITNERASTEADARVEKIDHLFSLSTTSQLFFVSRIVCCHSVDWSTTHGATIAVDKNKDTIIVYRAKTKFKVDLA